MIDFTWLHYIKIRHLAHLLYIVNQNTLLPAVSVNNLFLINYYIEQAQCE